MIRMGHEEFFIEPLNQRSSAGGGEEEEEGEGRRHLVYRSTAVIKTPLAINQSLDDVHRGENAEERDVFIFNKESD